MTNKEDRIQIARVVFGSRLAGPANRRRELDDASTRIAGILVPPRPDEPDNCCMSGCLNCVWDRYRDELEEWAEKSSEARVALATEGSHQQQRLKLARFCSTLHGTGHISTQVLNSTDDGERPSETWRKEVPIHDSANGDDLFAGVPVGIREFMAVEKKLKEKKLKRES